MRSPSPGMVAGKESKEKAQCRILCPVNTTQVSDCPPFGAHVLDDAVWPREDLLFLHVALCSRFIHRLDTPSTEERMTSVVPVIKFSSFCSLCVCVRVCVRVLVIFTVTQW